MGGAHPNHFLKIDDSWSGNETKHFLKECVEGNYDVLDSKVKVAVILFQHVATGQCPYVNCLARAQTTNESNNFMTMTMEACTIAAKQDGNTAVLNF